MSSLTIGRDLIPQMIHTDELGGFQLLEIRSSLPDELLMYADKLSMAHSLEVRVPYLDRTVVEYVQRLGAGFKVHNGSRKWLHRQVCTELLAVADPETEETRFRRKRRGRLVSIVPGWELQESLLDQGSLMFGLLKARAGAKLVNDHQSARQDNHKLLFSLVMFEQWLRCVQSVVQFPRSGAQGDRSGNQRRARFG